MDQQTLLANKDILRGKRILVVDDHRNIRLTLRMTLAQEGALVTEAETYAQALLQVGSLSSLAPPFDAILLDIRLPDGSGLDFLKLLHHHGHGGRVIMISGEGTVREAFQATEMGAFDFIEKPFTPERILVSLSRCLEFQAIQIAHSRLSQELLRGQEILGNSAPLEQLRKMISKVAATQGRVLILGESGTGKELIAKSLHRQSERRDHELVKVNCAAIPDGLVESELFGHEKGAFTGAIKAKKGLFEQADGGTLFLDEIGELDLNVQAKLLRVLQSGEMTRVGGEKLLKVDVRLIAATHRDLEELITQGKFREDLYFRLNVVTLVSPPLRERGDDILLLAQHFLKQACEEHAVGSRSLGTQALADLVAYHWPGNIRELKNCIERAVILSDFDEISQLPELRAKIAKKSGVSPAPPSVPLRESQEPKPGLSVESDERFHFDSELVPWEDLHQTLGRAYIKFALVKAKGNVSEAARLLCLERAYLHRLMKRHGIQRDIVVSD